MKRLLDLSMFVFLAPFAAPIIGLIALLVWANDRENPFYLAPRITKNGTQFKMIKFRTMVVNADRSGVDSTASNDPRITPIGAFLRRFKLDELPQLVNVIKGEMSFVGPRPNVSREVELYSPLERRLLEVRAGITDLASVVFSDEGEILAPMNDPDVAYNQLIRPIKSQLGLFYVDHRSIWLDLRVMLVTVLNLVDRERALVMASRAVRSRGGEEKLADVCLRRTVLIPAPPPGLDEIVTSRSKN